MSARLDAALTELAEAIRAEVRAELETAAPAPDRLLGINEAAAMLSLGRSKVYDLIGAGRLASIRAGRRRLIPADAIAEFIRTELPS